LPCVIGFDDVGKGIYYIEFNYSSLPIASHGRLSDIIELKIKENCMIKTGMKGVD
jgi:hypothetical protein